MTRTTLNARLQLLLTDSGNTPQIVSEIADSTVIATLGTSPVPDDLAIESVTGLPPGCTLTYSAGDFTLEYDGTPFDGLVSPSFFIAVRMNRYPNTVLFKVEATVDLTPTLTLTEVAFDVYNESLPGEGDFTTDGVTPLTFPATLLEASASENIASWEVGWGDLVTPLPAGTTTVSDATSLTVTVDSAADMTTLLGELGVPATIELQVRGTDTTGNQSATEAVTLTSYEYVAPDNIAPNVIITTEALIAFDGFGGGWDPTFTLPLGTLSDNVTAPGNLEIAFATADGLTPWSAVLASQTASFLGSGDGAWTWENNNGTGIDVTNISGGVTTGSVVYVYARDEAGNYDFAGGTLDIIVGTDGGMSQNIAVSLSVAEFDIVAASDFVSPAGSIGPYRSYLSLSTRGGSQYGPWSSQIIAQSTDDGATVYVATASDVGSLVVGTSVLNVGAP